MYVADNQLSPFMLFIYLLLYSISVIGSSLIDGIEQCDGRDRTTLRQNTSMLFDDQWLSISVVYYESRIWGEVFAPGDPEASKPIGSL